MITGSKDPVYNNVHGDGAGNLIVNWSGIIGAAMGRQYKIDCTVTDGDICAGFCNDPGRYNSC